MAFLPIFVPICASASGTPWNKHRLFGHFSSETHISAPLCALARLAQGGALYWALGDFSPNRAKDSAKVPSEAASAVVSTIKRIKGYAHRRQAADPASPVNTVWCRILVTRIW
jgi:hypothetical protein